MIETTNTYKIVDKDFAKEIAKHLLEINAVVLRPNDPFTWSQAGIHLFIAITG